MILPNPPLWVWSPFGGGQGPRYHQWVLRHTRHVGSAQQRVVVRVASAPSPDETTPPLSGTTRAAVGDVKTTSSWKCARTASTSCAFHAATQSALYETGSGMLIAAVCHRGFARSPDASTLGRA